MTHLRIDSFKFTNNRCSIFLVSWQLLAGLHPCHKSPPAIAGVRAYESVPLWKSNFLNVQLSELDISYCEQNNGRDVNEFD